MVTFSPIWLVGCPEFPTCAQKCRWGRIWSSRGWSRRGSGQGGTWSLQTPRCPLARSSPPRRATTDRTSGQWWPGSPCRSVRYSIVAHCHSSHRGGSRSAAAPPSWGWGWRERSVSSRRAGRRTCRIHQCCRMMEGETRWARCQRCWDGCLLLQLPPNWCLEWCWVFGSVPWWRLFLAELDWFRFLWHHLRSFTRLKSSHLLRFPSFVLLWFYCTYLSPLCLYAVVDCSISLVGKSLCDREERKQPVIHFRNLFRLYCRRFADEDYVSLY